MEQGHERVLTIKDSGERTLFETGAVRDIQKGKGRCDLMPLDVTSEFLTNENGQKDKVLNCIHNFQHTSKCSFLMDALYNFNDLRGWDDKTMLLEVAIHMENGCEKYGERNWQKGIPVSRYIDSAVRHYLKWLRGDDDEPHDRAFCWNIMCCSWTCKHKPELNDNEKEKS